MEEELFETAETNADAVKASDVKAKKTTEAKNDVKDFAHLIEHTPQAKAPEENALVDTLMLLPLVFLVIFFICLFRGKKFRKQFELVDKSAEHIDIANEHMQRMEAFAEQQLEELKQIRQRLERNEKI